VFVFSVVVLGAWVILQALAGVGEIPRSPYIALVAALTIASGRFSIKVPGRRFTVSVSEVFVFATILLFGTAAATLTVVLDGLVISITQHNRRIYRILFNVAEPAIATWIAGQVFFFTAGIAPLALPHAEVPTLVVPALAMAAAFFLSNSALTAVAVALESGGSAFDMWSRHAVHLAVNYYAAASLATLAIANASGLNLQVIGLVVPLLILSYVAYNEASTRVDQAQTHIKEVEHLYQATVETLAIAVDAKDQVTHGHIRRVQRHCVAVARALGVSSPLDLKAIEAASLLHDVGKLAVPDYILNKPGSLTPQEFEAIKLHATTGAMILSAVDFPFPVVPIVRHHHEQWDGRGYPDGIAGDRIPLGARILAVVDCFDALTSDRPYRRKLTDEEAIEILRSRSATTYDPAVVEAFIGLVPMLRSDDVAVEKDSGLVHVVATSLWGRVDLAPKSGQTPAGPAPEALPAAAVHALKAYFERRPGLDGCVFVPDRANERLVTVFATPRIRDFVISREIRIGEGLSGWIAVNRHTIVNSDPALDFGDLAVHLGLRSCMSTPVFALGGVGAILAVYSHEPRAFSDADTRTIGRLAQEVGLALADEGAGGSAVRPAARGVASPTPVAVKHAASEAGGPPRLGGLAGRQA
jgi:putative nucleotidyltransferase with HDIG domain